MQYDVERPDTASSKSNRKVKTEQHCRFAQVEHGPETLRRMSHEIRESHFTRSDEGCDAGPIIVVAAGVIEAVTRVLVKDKSTRLTLAIVKWR
ncbi:hypothetical protein AB4Y38_24445 [Paraburkholderia sp. EG285A]|uniref:hypothetical protein n=1 Tax=Paraburkholderia sp. EG285A TaxID=3237009 RepID=UPI0034D2558F